MAVMAAFILIPLASAQLPAPEVRFIPDQLSAGSSFAMVADPGEVAGPVRVNWVTGEGYGLFPYVDGKYMCYFSETDPNAFCGPSPFRLPSTEGYPYLVDINTIDIEGKQGNTSLNVEVGGLKLDPRVTVNSQNRATMVVYVIGGIADSVTYRVYDSSFSPVTSYRPLSLIPQNLAFNGSVSLGIGKFYIAFKANSSEDFGGGIYMVDTTGGSTGGVSYGVLQAESLNIEMFADEGTVPDIRVNKMITNTLNQTFSGVTISVPSTSPVDIRDYLRFTPSNSTILPNSMIYYNVSFRRAIDTGMDINTNAEIYSGGSILGSIPIRLKLSVRGSASSDCTSSSDGEKCLGGLCCDGVCRQGADCCSSLDCTTGTCLGYECVVSDTECIEGTCRASCYTGEEATTEQCTNNGITGVCCVEVNECEGLADGTPCSSGVCCNGFCEECCDDADCLSGYECIAGSCFETSAPSGGIDIITIILIIAIIGGAAFGVWYYLTKIKKKSSEKEEEDFEKDKKDEEELFDEEEFY